jgi:hypothetical protein
MSVQTDNSNEALKLAVRRWVWERIPERRVLDLYCGKEGRMWEGIWQEADSYLGCDKFRPHGKATTLKMSAERAAQFLSLDDYTIFDVDCYSSPWVVARKILRRRGPGTFGLCLTVGEDKGLKDEASEIIRVTTGIGSLARCHLLARFGDIVLGLMLKSMICIPGITAEQGIKATIVKQNQMYYLGLIVSK